LRKEITMFKRLMKKCIFLGFLLMAIYGCKSPIPKDIIQPTEMGKILYDIHLVDSYISTMPSQDTAKKVAAAYYKGIYKKFGTDSVAYNKSMDFYYAHPEIMEELYKGIQAQIQKTKTAIEKKQEAELQLVNKKRIRADSLRNDSVKKAALKKSKLPDGIAKKKADSIAKKKTDSLAQKKVKIAAKKKADSLAKKRLDSMARTKLIMRQKARAKQVNAKELNEVNKKPSQK
jgi:hypothetical protein